MQILFQPFPAEVAVLEDLVADFPVPDSKRCGMLNAQKILSVITRQRSRTSQTGPVSHCLPVVARGIFAKHLRVRRISVNIRNPRSRLRRSTWTSACAIGTVVHREDRRSHLLHETRKRSQVVRGRIPHVGMIQSLPVRRTIGAKVVGVRDPSPGVTYRGDSRRPQ